MSLLRLALAYLRARLLHTALGLVLLALGSATITVLVLFGSQLQDRLTRDLRGIDLVVGAKGSPLQLILSSVFQADIPTGNIPLEQAQVVRTHPLVRAAVPLAMGDSALGARIVGTEPAYLELYGAALAEGRVWQAPLEAVLGADVAARSGLGLGARFVGSHGLAGGGAAHADAPYAVVGRLAPTGTVVDRLVLTSVESVWQVHAAHQPRPAPGPAAPGAPAPAGSPDAHDDHDHAAGPAPAVAATPVKPTPGAEVTALLMRYKSPLAAVQLPRFVNAQPALQAASPAFEAARLFALVGVGLDTLRAFGALLIVAAGLGIFAALTGAMQERRYDLALMRAMGASRGLLVREVVLEALILVAAGTALGLLLGHALLEAAARLLPEAGGIGLTGLRLEPAEAWLVLGTLAVGLVAALLPAVQAYRTDIVRTLAQRT